MISLTGLTGDYVSVVRYAILVVAAFLLAWLAGWLCRRFIVPVLLKITSKTDAKWDDVLFSEKVLTSACRIIPAIVIWILLPLVFFEYPKVEVVVGRLTAIYFTIMMARTVIVFIDSFKELEHDARSSRRQYIYSICGVLKILVIFIAAIVVTLMTDNSTELYFMEKADHDAFMECVRQSSEYRQDEGSEYNEEFLGENYIQSDEYRNGWYVVTFHVG